MSEALLDPAATDLEALAARYLWLQEMRGCRQDPVHHAEGDVLLHTGMVVQALHALPAWEVLPGERRAILHAAALLHDIAKPACTVIDEEGRISSPGHAKRGERMARALLLRLQERLPFSTVEGISRLVRHHGLPLWFLDKPDPRRAVIGASLVTDTRELALLAEADARGRICADRADLLDRVTLFREFCRENHCYGTPFPFASDHARFTYFRKPEAFPDYAAYDDTRFEVTLMSGLPGSGKDTWVRQSAGELAVVSLDAIRWRLGIAPTDNQGVVIAEAKERAKALLRREQPFIWNATNITRQMRASLIDLFAGYGARIRIVYRHSTVPELIERNRRRGETALPESALAAMLEKLEVPDTSEAHRVDVV